MSENTEERFIKLVIEIDRWIDKHIAQCRMSYSGNEEGGSLCYIGGSLCYISDRYESSTPLPQDINKKINEVSSLANLLFINGSFQRDKETMKRVKENNPAIVFDILVGEQDSFGVVTWCLSTPRLLVVCA